MRTPPVSSLYVGTSRKLFNGRALLVVRATRQAGNIQVKADAEGVEGASTTITAQRTGTTPALP